MDAQNIDAAGRALRTPRAAAIAGVVFALLLGTALILIRAATPADPNEAGRLLEDAWRREAVALGLNLFPFAGLAFLWFIGAVRHQIGAAEDRFFATVFLGTGLLFVAMLFVTAAIAGGLLQAEANRGAADVSPEVWSFGRHASYLVLTVYCMRMAGAFTLVTTTITVRLGIVPRWLAALGIVIGIGLLVSVQSFASVTILFPVWVLVLSIYLLVRQRTRDRSPAEDDTTGARPTVS